jgi:hypothetical protein
MQDLKAVTMGVVASIDYFWSNIKYGQPSHVSGLYSFPTPQVFYTNFYNHAHRLRLEKLL